jgi:transcriptional regulator with XRE-family HTH domain
MEGSHASGGLGPRLRRARTRRGLKREELAVRAGLSWAAIAQIEAGRRQNVRPGTLSALAQALGVSIDYLVHGTVAPPMLEHRALFYGGREEYVGSVGPVVAEGIGRSEPTLVVTTEPNADALREFLGADATRATFVASDDVYMEPGAALATYLRFARRELPRGGWARIVGGPPWPRRPHARATSWGRYDSMINLALAALPVTVVCPFDESDVHPTILKQARATHPELIRKGAVSRSRDYADPGIFVLGTD